MYRGQRWHFTGLCDYCEVRDVDEPMWFCPHPAMWAAKWSDREEFVCDDHMNWVRSTFDEDHSYDQPGGIEWTNHYGEVYNEWRAIVENHLRLNTSDVP